MGAGSLGLKVDARFPLGRSHPGQAMLVGSGNAFDRSSCPLHVGVGGLGDTDPPGIVEPRILPVRHLEPGAGLRPTPASVVAVYTAVNELGTAHLLASGDERGVVSILDTRQVATGTPTPPIRIQSWAAHRGSLLDLQWCHKDTQLLTASSDHSAALLDSETSSRVATFVGHGGTVRSAAAHPTDPHLFTTASRDGSLRIWDTRCSPQPQLMCGPHPPLAPADVITHAHSLASVNAIHPRPSHSKRRPVEPPTKRGKHGSAYPVASAKFLPHYASNLAILSAGAVDGAIKVWDCRCLSVHRHRQVSSPVDHLTPSLGFNGRPYGFSCLELSHSGSVVYAACLDHSVYVVNANRLDLNPTRLQSAAFTGTHFTRVAVAPEDRFLAAGSTQAAVQIWDTHHPAKAPLSFVGHAADVTCVTWSAQSIQSLASCSDDRTIRVWRLEPCLSSGPIPRTPDGLPKPVGVGYLGPT
ncbi:hypothetical protein L0F63_005081 [Massospora cicadina]|nr:hypothetical protein L0F63_005081 [Massospora cicadina]